MSALRSPPSHASQPSGKLPLKKRHTARLLCAAGLGSLLAASAAPAFAQQANYFYGGLSLGQSRAEIDEERINAGLLGAGLTTTRMDKSETDTGFKLFGGYQFNRYIGVELGYFNLGTFGFTSTTSPAGTLNGEIKLQGVNLDLVGTLPLTEKFSLLGRVGAQRATAKDRFSGTGAVGVSNPNPSESEFNYKFGAGVQYELTPSVFVRAEAERYRINDAVGSHGDVDLYSVSLVFPFGRTPAVVAKAAPAYAAPVYVAPAPEPAAAPVVVAPPPVVVAAAPARRRVSFSADSLFTFDRKSIRPESRAELDAFVKELQDTRYRVVTVEGHTDRIGSTAYNQTLSEQRAGVVKAYLVNAGIDPAKISATGKGESMPETKPGQCVGDKPTPKLVACLQPDRRVDVDVTGTQ